MSLHLPTLGYHHYQRRRQDPNGYTNRAYNQRHIHWAASRCTARCRKTAKTQKHLISCLMFDFEVIVTKIQSTTFRWRYLIQHSLSAIENGTWSAKGNISCQLRTVNWVLGGEFLHSVLQRRHLIHRLLIPWPFPMVSYCQANSQIINFWRYFFLLLNIQVSERLR